MKKLILLTLLCVPFTSFAWVKPVLTGSCSGYTITVVPEANQIIEFSTDNFISVMDTVDFGGAGTYPVSYSVPNTLYARYKSDKGAKTYINTVSGCTIISSTSIVSTGRNNTPRRMVPSFVFDMVVFDYPYENLKD